MSWLGGTYRSRSGTAVSVDSTKPAVVFDVHRVASGEPNAALIDLAADVATAVQPLLRPVDSLAAEFGEVEAFIDDHYGAIADLAVPAHPPGSWG